ALSKVEWAALSLPKGGTNRSDGKQEKSSERSESAEKTERAERTETSESTERTESTEKTEFYRWRFGRGAAGLSRWPIFSRLVLRYRALA
ncbi:MAG: hypothetical protein HW398_139, partial [Acidobacteria bacterium]|nr:hypothetical protein [Acidobacteriota bacterium]